MIELPKNYAWLNNEGAPRMLVELLALYGTREQPGTGDNPVILQWAKEVGLASVYKHDETAWCGLTIALAAHRATWDSNPKGNALWARNWAYWGNPAPRAMLGDVLVFPRGTGGHVAMYVGEDDSSYHILGGNQSDAVGFMRHDKNPLAIRRAPWRYLQPPNVRVIKLQSTGAIGGKVS